MEVTVPKGMAIEAVQVVTGVGLFSYTLDNAITQGHIKPVNVSLGRYEAVIQGATYGIKIVLATYKGE